jgi:hypothetical protein
MLRRLMSGCTRLSRDSLVLATSVQLLSACAADTTETEPLDVGLQSQALVDQVVLTAVADTRITDWQPVTNYGTDSVLKISGLAYDASELGIVRFDQAAIRSALGSQALHSATLELTIDSVAWDWGNNQVAAHRMIKPWTEQGATWLCANDTDHGLLGRFVNNCSSANTWGLEVWNFAPLPYEYTATGSAPLSSGQTGKISIDVTADVVNVISGASHEGWLISPKTGLLGLWARFKSRESGSPARLVIQADLCPLDPLKGTPGQCGCGTPETDTDGDGTANCIDECPNDPNRQQAGQCGCLALL